MRPVTSSLHHGQYAYARKHKCTCQPCETAVSRYAKAARYDRARGIERRPDAEPYRQHVLELLDHGLKICQIARAAGVADTMVRNLAWGVGDKPPAKHLLRPTAEKIAAVTYETAARQPALVPAVGVHRRIRALEWMGHSKATIGVELGVSESMVFTYLKTTDCYTATIERMHEVYLRLRDQQGTSQRNRLTAWRNGWHPPMSWDDETIDWPETQPHPAACVAYACTRPAASLNLCSRHGTTVRAAGGHTDARKYNRALRDLSRRRILDGDRARQEIRDLRRNGYDEPGAVAYRLGMTKEYVERLWEETA